METAMAIYIFLVCCFMCVGIGLAFKTKKKWLIILTMFLEAISPLVAQIFKFFIK